MKRLLLAATAACALAVPAAAAAHPLGNFTINHFARVEVAGHRLYVRYVLDLAEIPAYQARQRGVDGSALVTRVARNLQVTVDGRRVALRAVAHALAFPPGAGGLHTLRLEAILRGPSVDRAARVELRDANDIGRIGWREIVVGADAPSVSHELRAYPRSLLQSPLDVTTLRATIRPTNDPVPRLMHGAALAAPDRVADGGFTKLISRRDLSPLVILAALAAALFWGAAHALSPGHGKTIVAAYLVGRRGRLRDAAALGAVVTVTHTIGVFALGLVTLLLSQWIVPDRLYPWLNLVAGVSVVTIGLAVLRARAREWLHERAHAHEHHHHHPEPAGGLRGLLAVGVSGGILPCPSALVVLLAAISLHRVAFGLVLIVAFSLGLALAITAVGAATILARQAFTRRRFDGLLVRALPAVSAAVILVAGVMMTVRALPKVS
jgi:ABC-type nickel/cobalt efflux system permease component RcnA